MLIDWDFCFLDENSLPSIIEGDKVDGVLLAGGFNKKMPVDRILGKNIPIVLVGSRHERFDYVDTNFELGLRLAMQHLLDYGHKNIAFINGPETSQSSRRKMDGYLQALRENKLEFREEFISSGNFTGRDGYLGMKRIIESGVRPTALAAATDGVALGAMRYLHEKGIYCPRDISIIGFEGGLLAEYSVPPLTTVNMRKEIIGEEASKILIKRLEKNKFKLIHLIIEPELNMGGSIRRI
jgi:DNA-binding LacI/PurR family transcriptional regulator